MIDRKAAEAAAYAYADKENMGPPEDQEAVEEATSLVMELVQFYHAFRSPDAQPLIFNYVNYRGEHGTRRVIPQYIFWGSTEWHPEPQYLMRAFDLDKQAERDFALKDIIWQK